MKRIAICLVLLTALLGFFPAATRAGERTYTLKLSTVLNDSDPITVGLREMAKKVDQRTGGKLKIQVYPSSQLGDTADVLEQAKNGSAVGVIIDTGMLADYVPEMAIYTAPYVFSDVHEARKFIETDMFKAWDEELATHGLRDLSCNWYQGARHFCTNVKVETLGDLANLRVRTMGSAVAQASMRALGAVPTSLPWSEAYSGLQAGVIDSVEAQLPAVHGASMQEVIKYVAVTGHFILNTALVTSEDWFRALPEEYRTILMEESVAAGDYATNLTLEQEKEIRAIMEKAGVTFTDPDLEPFRRASDQVYKSMGWEETKAKIDASLGK